MIESKLECLVATEIDAEGRRLTIVNHGAFERLIEVTSYGELVLSLADSDAAHPVFSKMFVKTEIGDSGDVIYASRNKRNLDEPTSMSLISSEVRARAGRSRRKRTGAHSSVADAISPPPGPSTRTPSSKAMTASRSIPSSRCAAPSG